MRKRLRYVLLILLVFQFGCCSSNLIDAHKRRPVENNGNQIREIDRYIYKSNFVRDNSVKEIFNIRTNLLLPFSNVGIEMPIASSWTVGLDYYFPWYLSKNNSRCYQFIAGLVNTKYWLKPLVPTGTHALGVYSGGGYYDFQTRRQKGDQGEFITLGADYTFVFPISRDGIRLEFNLGIGYVWTKYRPYNVIDGGQYLCKRPEKRKNYFGPSKAGIILVIPILRDLRSKRK